jgi:uncharacterized protein YjiK
MKQTTRLWVCLTFLQLIDCQCISGQKNFPYALDKPTSTFTLPTELAEVSGLTISPDAEQLAALQDERGQLFFIHKKTGKATPALLFQNDGDFEGIEFVGDTLWAVKSNGRLFKIWNWQKTPFDMTSFKIENLKKKDNIEGLGYDAVNKRLLLSQKGEKADGTWSRAIFAFDLTQQTPSVSKAFELSLTDFQTFLNGKKAKKYEKLTQDYVTAPQAGGLEFGPSGVAVQPETGNIYILSSINKVLVILNAKGKIIEMVKLDKTVFAQPEGITFDADGTLYISTEAKDGAAARVFVFPKREKK